MLYLFPGINHLDGMAYLFHEGGAILPRFCAPVFARSEATKQYLQISLPFLSLALSGRGIEGWAFKDSGVVMTVARLEQCKNQ